MAEISTPKHASHNQQSTKSNIGPKQSTLDFIRQFARTYISVSTPAQEQLGGILLN